MLVLARIFLLLAGLPALAQTSFPHEECIKRAASQYDLEPALIAAVASVESGLNAQAVSSSDAIGLMQIKWPLTAKHLGILNKQQLFEPCTNIGAGSKYLRELLNRFEYEMAALAAYHFGPTAVTKTKAVPIETLNYIQKVLDEKNYILKSGNFNKAVVCNPLDLRANASETHDPLERRDLALDWIEETALVCSISELVLIRNRLSAWFGTSNSDGKIGRALDSVIISKSSDP